jgi:hypothetical protein
VTPADTDAAVIGAIVTAAVAGPVIAAPPPAVPLNLDAMDPLVAVATWGLTQGVARYMPKDKAARRFIPAIAVGIAIGVRTGIEAAQGHALTADVLLRAIGSGMAAVALHSQGREAAKWHAGRKAAAAPPEAH